MWKIWLKGLSWYIWTTHVLLTMQLWYLREKNNFRNSFISSDMLQVAVFPFVRFFLITPCWEILWRKINYASAVQQVENWIKGTGIVEMLTFDRPFNYGICRRRRIFEIYLFLLIFKLSFFVRFFTKSLLGDPVQEKQMMFQI